jgi:hypothetical protein
MEEKTQRYFSISKGKGRLFLLIFLISLSRYFPNLDVHLLSLIYVLMQVWEGVSWLWPVGGRKGNVAPRVRTLIGAKVKPAK